jgi:hypothetical protein
MNAKRAALLGYILVGGFGLWLGQSVEDLLAVGVIQPVINMLSNGAGVGAYILGAVIIYVLGGNKEDLPAPPKPAPGQPSE